MTSSQQPLTEDQIAYIGHQHVMLTPIDTDGFILDIGGGGEGVIGQLHGAQVVAIDRQRRELDEAAPGPLKIVMDARDLHFVDHAFGAATAFYALMYIPRGDHAQVFREVFRVLRPGTPFLIWDTAWPEPDPDKRVHAVRVTYTIRGEARDTGYGLRRIDPAKNLAHYRALAERTGFETTGCTEDGLQFMLRLQKPERAP